jgi:hypothetical protein
MNAGAQRASEPLDGAVSRHGAASCPSPVAMRLKLPEVGRPMVWQDEPMPIEDRGSAVGIQSGRATVGNRTTQVLCSRNALVSTDRDPFQEPHFSLDDQCPCVGDCGSSNFKRI